MSAPHKPTLALFALCAFIYTAAQAADKIPVATVDSGSFGVFRNSHRIGMETFSSTILDNNFFVLRQVLAWRYLATSCKTDNGSLSCPKIPARLPAVVPQDHMSMSANVSLLGREKVRIGQAERELVRLVVDDDSGIWQLWLDDQDKYKMVRMVMAANGVEVVRE
jgi:hypothetical protein